MQAAHGRGLPLGGSAAWLVRTLNLVKSKFFAQPNLLADRRVVGEYFQEQIVPGSLGAELLMWLDDAGRRAELGAGVRAAFTSISSATRARARAQAIMALVHRERPAAVP